MFQAKITSSGNEKYHATTRHAEFDMASDGSSSKPTDVLLASLCACLGHYVGAYLQEQKIAFSNYSLSAESDLAEDESRLGDIRLEIEIADAKLDDKTKGALQEYITRCHIYATLRANSKILFRVTTR